MNLYDWGLFVWVLIGGWLGFSQGLSIIILRFVLAMLGMFLIQFCEPVAHNFFLGLLGPEAHAKIYAVLFLIGLIFIFTETTVYLVRRFLDATILKWPDRLAGAIPGLVISFVVGLLVSLHFYFSSESFKLIVDESAMSVVFRQLQPLLRGVSEPTF